MVPPLLIATAGHVDHGKSTLVRSLTGVDPDRWAEEKARGITIDLGYAHMTHGARTYSFVDVPGHEKFIHNMLAGIGSIDGVLMIIAADESIMPQTREHARALAFLGVPNVAVVLTKTDLVDEELLDLVHMEVDEFCAEFGWQDAPRVGFSARRAETAEAVLSVLAGFEKQDRDPRGSARLSVDRVFTSPGSGTVVTGTTERGTVRRGDKLTLLPGEVTVRVRQLQQHGVEVEEVGPHARAALNLSGAHYKDIHRGDQLHGGLEPLPSTTLLVRLTRFEQDWSPSAKHQIHFHHLAARLMGRLLWSQDDLAAVALEQPYAFQALDKGLIRDGSPTRVLAGFEVLHPRLHPAKRGKVRHLLDDPPAAGDLLAWQRWFLAHQKEGTDLNQLRRLCGADLAQPLRETMVFVAAAAAHRRKPGCVAFAAS